MDIYDRATEREEQDRKMALDNRRPAGPPATGQCLNCGEALPHARAGQPAPRWCDCDCRADWEMRT